VIRGNVRYRSLGTVAECRETNSGVMHGANMTVKKERKGGRKLRKKGGREREKEKKK
jgi:hypothetical protein